MSRATFHVGDALTILPTLKAGSVDLSVGSPPFFQLRSYLPTGHPLKHLEHGSEKTPAAFLATLIDVTEEIGRVLAPHGSHCFEIGDTYSGSGGAGGDYNEDGLRDGQERFKGSAWGARQQPGNFPPAKSLCMIPSLYAASLAYGRNLLAQPDQPEWREFAPWRIRNQVAWVRPNPPVGALGDKWRPATSYITVATRSPTRWWDDIATRRPSVYAGEDASKKGDRETDRQYGRDVSVRTVTVHDAGAPLLDWWNIPPTGYTSRLGAHYATFPDELVTPLIQAMCPRRVCTVCGAPSRRLLGEPEYRHQSGRQMVGADLSTGWDGAHPSGELKARSNGKNDVGHITKQQSTVGWSSCGCPGADGIRDDGYHTGPTWRPGMVLDCYAGTGTVGLVATGHGRDATLIDLNPTNAILAEERLGMFLDVIEGAA